MKRVLDFGVAEVLKNAERLHLFYFMVFIMMSLLYI